MLYLLYLFNHVCSSFPSRQFQPHVISGIKVSSGLGLWPNWASVYKPSPDISPAFYA